MEFVKTALAIMSGLIPVLYVANYYLAKANRIL
jgi:hypothetical protein